MISDDASLLRQYVTEGSEAAFAELVRRHVDLVHSAALRQVGRDLHRAQDVTQAVFCELARKAPRLLQHRALSGWLYTTARFVGARFQRTDTRRIARELTSHAMTQILEQPASDPTWSELLPVLDEAMDQLGEKDRQAIVQRFFENKPLAEVGNGLGLTENAARMRVERAIEKLRGILAGRGLTSTTSVLGTVLAANAIAPAPNGLAATVVGPALASGLASTATSTGTAIALFHFMNSAKVGMGVAALAIASAVGTYVAIDRDNAKLRAEIASLQNQTTESKRTEDVNQPAMESPVDPDELGRFRSEHFELLRLRGEVTALRADKAELARLQADKAQRDRLAPGTPISPEQAAELVKNIGIVKMNFARGWGAAFREYAEANGGKMPETFAEAGRFGHKVPPEWQFSMSALSIDDFEIVYHGSLLDLEHPERTIVLREKQPFDIQASGLARRTYLFADGHSEVHLAENADFEPWEKERMALVAK
jgi:RNA polymerase sigma factor (sigma-70 family)